MAEIGDILDEFFSPISRQRLWVMSERDQYTTRVRAWAAVQQAQTRIRANLASSCNIWAANFRTNASWSPSITTNFKPGSYRDQVSSPAGTHPSICRRAFEIYVASKAARVVGTVLPAVPILPEVQTNDLYICSIGSFTLYATVDAIDCGAKTATLNYWMYNVMSRGSFGSFANNPIFAACGMQSQFMYWNWLEDVTWTGAVPTVVPRASANRW